MDELQQAEQIRHQLASRYWGDSGSNALVFGKVASSAGPRESIRDLANQCPVAIINAMGSVGALKGLPQARTFRWQILVMVSNMGDPWGEGGLIGSNWQGFGTQSEGAGILHVQRELCAALNPSTGREGLRLALVESRSATASEDPDAPPVTFRMYQFESQGTEHPVYATATRLAATAGGSGAVTLTWLLPTGRYDFYKAVLRYASGATPPASTSAGTGVTLSADDATTVTFSPGAGTYSFALFVQYDEKARDAAKSTVTATSAAETLASVVVT